MTNVSTTFVPDGLKYESTFSGLIFDAEEFLCDEVVLRVKLFVYKQKFVNFRLDLFFTYNKCTKHVSLLILALWPS